MAEAAPFFMYKDKPLVRKDNEIYYGYVSEGYFIMMRILDKPDVPDETKLAITLVHQKEDGSMQLLNSAQRTGTYNALELADFWLTDALAGEKAE